jgi:exodeoxyribonuclease V beta subunit
MSRPLNGLRTMEDEAINLDKHAIVEASAGTGKTYTIEQLVLRLLREGRASLDQVLVMTFAEKAAGELKVRLRTALEGEFRTNADLRPVVQAALDTFDQAPIFTIHGFCRRVLTEYALEQGQELHRELVHDQELVDAALREVQRRIWRQEFGDQLKDVLELADYNLANAEKWETCVRTLACKYRPEFGHLLRPAARPDSLVVGSRQAACRALRAKLRAFTGEIPADPDNHLWYFTLFSNDDLHLPYPTRKHRREKVLAPLLFWLSQEGEQNPLLSFGRFQDAVGEALVKQGFADKGFEAFFDKMSLEAQEKIAESCPGLCEAIRELESFRRTSGPEQLADQLAVKTIAEVRQVLAAVKAEQGQFSFDDMIAEVDRALGPARAGSRHFLAALRHRFRYAVVDEFQDTDPVQWRILERLFLEGGDSRLIVVGDPKQAIFNFRGADLPTYVVASRAMEHKYGAVRRPLKSNWRTVDALLRPLNRLFASERWFVPDDDIRYLPVHAPPAQPTRIEADPSDRAPFNMVNLQDAPTLVKARKQFASFAAGEIRRLLGAGIRFTRHGTPSQLHAGHVCVLVFKRTEADPLVEALRSMGVPYSFYKQTGLWSSTEADHLGIVLQALASPDDRAAFRKALLTSFFRLNPVQLSLCEDIPPRHPARVLFDRWLGFIDKRRWSALAQSLLEDTGVLFHDLEAADLDRRAGNLRYLLATLEEAAYRDNFDLLDLLEFFDNRRRRGDDPQSDWQPIETERPKVQIMTIHAAKGLEFPIVFLAGGFTKAKQSDDAVYHDAENRRVFDLRPDSRAKEKLTAEQLSESRRLLYVGLTRAMLKLYVPLVNPAVARGQGGPVVTVLHPALEVADLAQLGTSHVALVEPGAAPFLRSEERPAGTAPAGRIAGDLFPVLDADLGKRQLVVRSFSSLHRAAPRIHFAEETARAEDEGPDLPEDPFRGTVFGEIVHEALERIDFAAVGAAADCSVLLEQGTPLRAALDAPIARHLPKMRSRVPLEQFRDACLAKVADLVWRALRTPLVPLGCPLSDVPRSQRIHELEFLFPQRLGETAPAEVRLEEGFLTGFMDLVFRKDGFYYLLDWKTNFLDAYDEPGVARAMEAGDYERQYRLYLHALGRWLGRRHGPDFDFLKRFGGVYYLFLRGMTGTEGRAGIFFHRPAAEDLNLSLVLEPRR